MEENTNQKHSEYEHFSRSDFCFLNVKGRAAPLPKIKVITAQKMKSSIKNFFGKCDQIRWNLRFGHIYWRNP